jgi:hypothetical protein
MISKGPFRWGADQCRICSPSFFCHRLKSNGFLSRTVTTSKNSSEAPPEKFKLAFAKDPAHEEGGEREPATIILASAAAIAALTPILKELIRSATGRPTVITEMRPVAVLDGERKPVLDQTGAPLVRWAEVSHDLTQPQSITAKGFGLSITIGRER